MIQLDSSSAAAPTNTTALTWSHTCTGSNLTLIVGVYDPDGLTTGVTYNGVSMTQITSQSFNGTEFHAVYKLISPATGAHNIVVTRTAGGGFQVAGTGASYTGTSATQPDSYNSATNSGVASITTSTTVLASNSWLVSSGYWTGIGAGHLIDELGTNSVLRQQSPFNAKQVGYILADTNAIIGVNSQSLQLHTVTSSGAAAVFSQIVISLAPVSNENPLFF